MPDEKITFMATVEMIYLLNNFLQGGTGVRASEYVPPVENGAKGLLAIECLVVDEYEEAAKFLHDPHGTVVRRQHQEDTYVFAVSDDAQPGGAFPQQVTFTLEWRYLVA